MRTFVDVIVLAVLVTVALFTSGCQSVPTMSADQLSSLPNGAVVCGTYTGVGGTGTFIAAKLDQTSGGGNVAVDPHTCGVTIVSDPAVVAAAKAAAAAARASKP